MEENKPEELARSVIEECADCDICRFLMEDTPCQVFPELYKLYDKEKEKNGKITAEDLRNLVELCNYCALCPCNTVRSNIMRAKHAFVSRDGLKPTIRLLEDVERVARLCGAYPRLANTLFRSGRTGGLLKKLAGIHEDRKAPEFPKEDFPTWAKRRGLHIPQEEKGRKVAFFAGCTGQYLFPEVPKAAVEVLQRNGIGVYLPEQKCCGMPSLLEGDQQLTFEFAASNMERLAEAVEAGYDIVCSCPTCGYMLRYVLSEGASYSAEHREAKRPGDGAADRGAVSHPLRDISRTLGNVVLEGLYKDEGYFAPMSALKRIRIASHTYDLGEYLRDLHRSGNLNANFGPISARSAYYPPCHLREQKIGEPYADLLSLVPGISMERIGGAFYCCGISGIMGFKRDFHEVSVRMGSRLMKKIRAIDPERLVSDCLSCRIQFNQLLPYEPFHPIEILNESYVNYGS
ncbi:MAG: FeS-binding protein [Syntrophales bacterium LBB04]|nr:FeS-binding protein [Syntrophales bacterium LBB04]